MSDETMPTPPTLELPQGKIYFTIGDVETLLGQPQSRLRYWEKTFDVIKPHRNKKGDRLFTRKDVETLGLIKYLVDDCGLTLKGTQQKIAAMQKSEGDDNGTVASDNLVAKSQAMVKLQALRDMLQEIYDNI